MNNLKSFAASAHPGDDCSKFILAAHADGLLTDAQRDDLQAKVGAIGITTILSILTSLPTLLAAISKGLPQIMQAIQQIIDLFKNRPVPTPPDGGGTVPPVPLSQSLAAGLP